MGNSLFFLTVVRVCFNSAMEMCNIKLRKRHNHCLYDCYEFMNANAKILASSFVSSHWEKNEGQS